MLRAFCSRFLDQLALAIDAVIVAAQGSELDG